MARRIQGSLLAFGILALALSVAPLTAQTASGAAAVKQVNVARSNVSSAATAASTISDTPQKGMVWVNTASGVYHREGTKSYGKTRQGKYMTEADALKAGYHVAKREAKP